MSEPGDKLARRYRSLAREEPPRALDDAILAASRREVGAGPGRARSGVSRWAGPVSIAAVLVLGIGVSLRMQLEKPGIETSIPAAQPSGEYPLPQGAEPAPAPAPAPATPAQDPAAPPAAAKRPAPAVGRSAPATPQVQSAPAEPPAQPAPAPQAQSAPAPRAKVEPQAEMAAAEPMQDQAKPLAKRLEAPAERKQASPPPPPAAATTAITAGAAPAPQQAPMRAKREGFSADSAARESRALGAVADPDPARELERIARLREAGRHAEADRALEELRRRHPDFRIPEAMWERVKPR